MDHGHKRVVISDPQVEQTRKQPRLEIERGEEQSLTSATTLASEPVPTTLTAEEQKYEDEVNESSASSDEEKST